MDKKSIQELSIDSRVLYDRLIKMSYDQNFISYKDLSKIIGRNIQDEARGNLATARRMALREDGMVFGVVRNKGLKLLNDIETVNTGEDTLHRISRISRKGAKQVISISDFDGLPNDIKSKHNAILSVLGAFRAITKPKAIKRLEAKIGIVRKQLPVAKTLRVFTGNGDKPDETGHDET